MLSYHAAVFIKARLKPPSCGRVLCLYSTSRSTQGRESVKSVVFVLKICIRIVQNKLIAMIESPSSP